MKATTTPPPTKPGRFRVGDRVRPLYGFPGGIAEILEDHGPLGVGGRRFYTVRLTLPGPGEALLTAFGEDEMESAAAQPAPSRGTA